MVLIGKGGFIVGCNDTGHVWEAAVAGLSVVSIGYFVKLVCVWESFVR